MDIHFQKIDPTSSTLRAQLLRQSLWTHLQSQLPDGDEVLEISDEVNSTETLELLSALPLPRQRADVSLFVGLTNAPSRMTGRNILVCTRALSKEWNDFAARNDMAGNLPLSVLSLFEKIVFLDPADFRASLGFAATTSLDLADGFHLLLEPVTQTGDGSVLVFQHDALAAAPADTDGHGRFARECRHKVVNAETDMTQLTEYLAGPNIHVHVGWTWCCETSGLTPIDSIISGAYTVVLLPPDVHASVVGQEMQELMKSRSYCEIADGWDAVVDICQRLFRHNSMLQDLEIQFNPEISRFTSMNSEFTTLGRNQLLSCLEHD